MRRRFLRTLAHAAGVVLIGFVLWSAGWNDRVDLASGVRHEGLRSAFVHLAQGPGWAAAGLLLHLLALLISFARWRLLLAGADLPTPWVEVLRLSWVGQFFAALLPGGMGSGDLVKALYVARSHAGRRTRSVVTVFADRGLGLLALCLLAGAAVLLAPASSRLSAVRGVILILLAGGLLVLALLFSRRMRNRLWLSRLAGRLPFKRVVGELGEAGAVYSRRPAVVSGAIAISFLAQSCVLAAFYCYGRALGIHMSLLAVGAAIPVAQMLAAIPALPGGWGVGDAAFLAFLPAAGVPAGPAVALSITYRILQTILSLPGALWLSGARRDPVPAT